MDSVDKKKTVKYFFDTAPDCRNKRVKVTCPFYARIVVYLYNQSIRSTQDIMFITRCYLSA